MVEEWKLWWARKLDSRERWEGEFLKGMAPVILLACTWIGKDVSNLSTFFINLGLIVFSQYIVYLMTSKYVGRENLTALLEGVLLEFLVLVVFILLAGYTGGVIRITEYLLLLTTSAFLMPAFCLKRGRSKSHIHEIRYYYKQIKVRYGVSDRGQYLTEKEVLSFLELDSDLTNDLLLTWEQASKITKDDQTELKRILHLESNERFDERVRRELAFRSLATEIMNRKEGASES